MKFLLRRANGVFQASLSVRDLQGMFGGARRAGRLTKPLARQLKQLATAAPKAASALASTNAGSSAASRRGEPGLADALPVELRGGGHVVAARSLLHTSGGEWQWYLSDERCRPSSDDDRHTQGHPFESSCTEPPLSLNSAGNDKTRRACAVGLSHGCCLVH